MKIKETIERECCENKDLKPYHGKVAATLQVFHPRSCVHCGQVWMSDSEMGPAGSNEPVLNKASVTY